MPFCLQCGQKAHYAIPKGDSRERIVCYGCGYIHYENPKMINGCVLAYGNKVLLCRRAIEPRYGFWTLPAGFMEIGETMAEGANRECMEEAEAVGENLQLYCLYDIPELGDIHAFFVGSLKDGAFGVGEESLECGLFAEDEIDFENLAFETVARTLKHYFNDRKTGSVFGSFPLHQEIVQKRL